MMRVADGFTVVELLIVITVIGILSTISVITPMGLLPKARDNERADDTASIVRRLEQAYNDQTVGSPSYPTTCQLMSDIASGSGTVALLSKDSLQAPGTSGSGVVAAAGSSCSPAVAMGSPTNPSLNQYVYEPFARDGSLCTTAGVECVRFNLSYIRETDGNVITLRSFHQQ